MPARLLKLPLLYFCLTTVNYYSKNTTGIISTIKMKDAKLKRKGAPFLGRLFKTVFKLILKV